MFGVIKISLKIFVVFIIVVFFAFIFSRGHVYDKNELEYGVTFSQKEARDLGLDGHDLFVKILDELSVKKIRLVAYWDEIQPQDNNEYNWSELDWQINEASKRNTEVILAMGGRVPRWPECHFPGWIKDASKADRETKTLEFIAQVINRYKNNAAIKYWQIENEPFLIKFGECPEPDAKFLDQEIALARSLDSRLIVVTDSGELSLWAPAARRADVFGTTMYRDTYSKTFNSYIHYPIAPGFFRFKKNIVSFIAHPQKWIVIELQAEPWGPKSFQNLTTAERDRTMNLEKFKAILEFSRQTGFKEFYLWGVEYWYWEKVHNDNAGMWNEAKLLFSK